MLIASFAMSAAVTATVSVGSVLAAALTSAAGQLPTPPGVVGEVAEPAGVWPVTSPSVLRPFDVLESPYSAGHRGVDLAADVGQPVRAALSGTISFAGPVAGRSVVVVQHANGLRTTYEPVTARVSVGEPVKTGQRIGTLDAGTHCGVTSCLHWGLRDADVYLDPLSLLGSLGPIVLLPLDDALRR